MKEYIDELNTRLLLLKEELPESYKIDFFRNGLKPIIRAGVMAAEPKTLRDCIDKAIQIYYSGKDNTPKYDVNRVEKKRWNNKEIVRCHYCDKRHVVKECRNNFMS